MGYHFFCDDFCCRNSENQNFVVISGANYKISAEEAHKYRVAHFRHKGTHIAGCAWIDTHNRELIRETTSIPIANQQIRRLARRKKSDLITTFDPTENRQTTRYQITNDLTGAVFDPNGKDESAEGSPKRLSDGESRTSSLERLVESHIEAKASMSWKDLYDLHLHVKGVGDTTHGVYFQRISTGNIDGVAFGGAFVAQANELAIVFKFFDRYENKQILLTINQSQLDDYKFRTHVLQIVCVLQQANCYAKVYALGLFVHDETENTINLGVKHLRHLYVVPTERHKP